MTLLTDLYQLTMANGYWKLGMHEREAVFELIFRKHPFSSHYAVSCGLAAVIDYLQQWRFSQEDLVYLSSLKASQHEKLLDDDFLTYLKSLRFTCDLDAIPEGTVVFAHEPLLRIKGPLIQCQLLESILLNVINFQTLIATKASRVCHVVAGDPVFEFGLRRAQGPDGALSASRAAYVGGCTATSNVLAGKLYDIPVRGTHAHSWVTAFPDELMAFAAYAEVMPHNCVLLIDTFDTLRGAKRAIEIGKKLRAAGKKLQAVRLDSGDLASLSIQVRQLLDKAGFTETKIIASNSLDEYVMQDLLRQDAQIDIWGVGTGLVTAYDHPALDGVYKLTALRDEHHVWQYKLKLSEQPVKTSNPGIHQIRRFFYDDEFIADVIYDIELGIAETPDSVLLETTENKKLTDYDAFVDLQVPVFQQGKLVYTPESIHDIRARALQQVEQFFKKSTPESYPVSLEKKLFEVKQKLIEQAKNSV